jgi:hypothetical protein
MKSAPLFPVICRDLLRRGCEIRFDAVGGSMHPTIRHGETIVAAPAKPERLSRGDIILYEGGAGVLVHRLVAIDRGRTATRLVTRGDAHTVRDAPIDVSKVWGKVVAVERDGKRINLDAPTARLAFRARALRTRARSTLGVLLRRASAEHSARRGWQ